VVLWEKLKLGNTDIIQYLEMVGEQGVLHVRCTRIALPFLPCYCSCADPCALLSRSIALSRALSLPSSMQLLTADTSQHQKIVLIFFPKLLPPLLKMISR
jgi:hypothetical protein